MGEPVLVVEKLKIESNPFVPGAGGGRMGRPLQKTLGELIRQIGLETPVVVVSGSPGTGKTLLANMATRACADMGLSVRRIHRGDLVDVTAGERSDLLLVDEADSMPDTTLHTLLCEGDKRLATTTVLLCLPASVRRFGTVMDSVVVELTRLSQSDTRLYLLDRATQAGFADLFAPAALDLIVDASRGLPRSLWSIAGLAYFSAASAGARQISRQNVADALASQITRPELPEAPVPAVPSVKLVTDTPVRTPTPPPVVEPPRASASVAVFPGIIASLAHSKRTNLTEAPASQMARSESEEIALLSAPPAAAPVAKEIVKSAEPLVEPLADLPKTIEATPIAEAEPVVEPAAEAPVANVELVEAVVETLVVPAAFEQPAEPIVEALIVSAPSVELIEPIAETLIPPTATAELVEPVVETLIEPVAFEQPAKLVVEALIVSAPSVELIEPIAETFIPPTATAELVEPVAETLIEPVVSEQPARPVVEAPVTRLARIEFVEPVVETWVAPASRFEVAEPISKAPAVSAAPLSFARADAAREVRRPLVTIARVAGGALALAAAVALAIYVPPMFQNEKAPDAARAANIAIVAPVVANPASVTPANPEPPVVAPVIGTNAVTPAGQAADKTASLSNPPKPAANPTVTKPAQAVTAPAAPPKPAPAAPQTAKAVVAAPAPGAPKATATPLVVPLENNAANAVPVQANAAPDTANQPPSAAEAEARAQAVAEGVAKALAAQQQAERDRVAKEAASEAMQKAIREAIARDAASRVNAAMRAAEADQAAAKAAAQTKANEETLDRQRRAFQHSLFGVSN